MTGLAFAVALVLVALLAWNGWCRWLAHGKRIDAARLAVVDEMATRVAEVKTEVANLKLQMGMKR